MKTKKKAAKKVTKKSTKAKTISRIAAPREPDSYKTFDRLVDIGSTYGTVLDLPHQYKDDRGIITNVLTQPCGSVVIITSEPNTVRANHWHKEDAHLCHVLSGSVHYYEREVGSTREPDYVLVKAGQSFITGPNREHAMKFTERTVFLTLGKLSRTPKEYEADLVRLATPLARPSAVLEKATHETVAPGVVGDATLNDAPPTPENAVSAEPTPTPPAVA